MEIIRRRVPAARMSLVEHVGGAVDRLRTLDLQKVPGIAEAIAWVAALEVLGLGELTPAHAGLTIGSVLKYREDVDAAGERGLTWVATGIG